MIAKLRIFALGVWTILLIDHVIVDPASGRHYFVLRAL